MSCPFAIRPRTKRTMSSCNVQSVNLEISPTSRGVCTGQTSCNVLGQRAGNATGAISWLAAGCAEQASCNVPAVRRGGTLPITRMGRSPLLHPLHVLRPAEVVPVFGFAQPALLPSPLAGRLTRRRRTILLAFAIPVIRQKQQLTMQTLATARLGLHRNKSRLP
jgi:hypothetical protein